MNFKHDTNFSRYDRKTEKTFTITNQKTCVNPVHPTSGSNFSSLNPQLFSNSSTFPHAADIALHDSILHVSRPNMLSRIEWKV